MPSEILEVLGHEQTSLLFAVGILVLGVAAALITRTPLGWSAAVATVLLYATVTAARLSLTTRGRGVAFFLRSLAWLLLLLPAMDLAKMTGFLAGRLARLRGRAGA